MCRHRLDDGLIILPQCQVVHSRIKCDSRASFILQQSCLWFILSPAKHDRSILSASLQGKKRKFLNSGLANLMQLKLKGRQSDLPGCTWRCAPDGMVLFASFILSWTPNLFHMFRRDYLIVVCVHLLFTWFLVGFFSDVMLSRSFRI